MSAPPTSAASPAAAAHFALYRHTVVSRMLRRLTRGGFLPGPTAMPAQQRAAAEGADPFAFLLDEQEAMRSGQQDGLDHDAAPAWWDEQLRAFEVATRDHLSLRSQPGGHTDARLVVAAGLIEDDIRYGSVFAALQAPLPSRRPCIGLLTWLLADSNDDLARLSAR